jgi:hypothetical protein
MRALSSPVLGGAALLSSPALWGAFVDGTTSMQTALTRYLVTALLVWAALAVVGMLVGPAPRPPVTTPGEATGAATVSDREPTG